MTDRAVWREILRWRKRLQLADWELGWERVAAEHVAEGTDADITYQSRYRTAALRLATQGRSEDSIKCSVRHEMLHLAAMDLDAVFEAAVRQLGHEAQGCLRGMWAEAQEQTCARLERAFEDAEPLTPPGQVAFQDPRV